MSSNTSESRTSNGGGLEPADTEPALSHSTREVQRTDRAALLWLGASALASAISVAVFLRWQRGLFDHEPGGSQRFEVAALLWLALTALGLALTKWQDWQRSAPQGPAGSTVPALNLLSLSALSHCLVPASLPPAGVLLAALCLWVCRKAGGRAIVLAVAITLPLSFWASYERQYGLLSRDALEAVLQTHSSEALSYVAQHLTLAHGGVLLCWFLLMALLWRRRIDPSRKGLTLLCLVWPLAFVAAGAVATQLLAAREVALGMGTHPDPQRLPQDVSVMSRQAPGVDVILVLGESSTRWNWSLYGYPRITTPQLSQQADDGDWAVFRDAVSAHSHTAPAVRAMLYRRSEGLTEMGAATEVSLLAVLRNAGVRVQWLSAQTQHGPFSNLVSALANSADETRFFESPTRWIRRQVDVASHPDLLAFAALHTAIATEPAADAGRLLVLHQHLSHFPYCANVPKESAPPQLEGLALAGPAYFGEAADRSSELDCYDRSLLLNDRELAGLFAAVKHRPRATIVIFSPDHGEAVDEGTAHQSDRHSARHIEIPLLVSFNAEARRRWPQRWAAIQGNATRPMMNAWLYETLLDLLDVRVSGLQLPASSVARSDFVPPSRVVFEGPRPLLYDQRSPGDRKDAIGATRANLEFLQNKGAGRPSLYAHRVNTLGKALEAKRYFDGIELDVIQAPNGKGLTVTHPPAPDVGLGLDAMLVATRDRPGLRLWLDLKQPLDARTAQALGELDARHGLRRRTLLELTAGAEPGAAKAMAAQGWRLAMPALRLIPSCLDAQASSGPCDREVLAAAGKVAELGAGALSFELRHAGTVRERLIPGLRGIGLYAWELRFRSDDEDFVERLARAPRLDGLVVRYRSKFER